MFYIDSIPYLRTIKKQISLPKGNPIGHDSCVFLLSPNLSQSYKMVNGMNMLHVASRYRYFYHKINYLGDISGRRFNINRLKERQTLKEAIEKNIPIKVYPTPAINSNINYNMYYDLSMHMEIFSTLSKNFTIDRMVSSFWNYLYGIINDSTLSHFNTKMIILDISAYKKISSNTKMNMNNPAFLLYYALYKNLEWVNKFDIDVVLYAGQNVLKINPSKADKYTNKMYLSELKKLYRTISIEIGDNLDDDKMDKDNMVSIATDTITKSLNFTGDEPIEGVITNLNDIDNSDQPSIDEINSKVKEVVKKDDTDNVSDIITQVDDEIDDSTIKELYKASQSKALKRSAASSARDKLLREKQEEIVVGGMTLKELKKINASKVEIPVRDVSNVVHTTNENMKKIRFNQINQTYIDKVMTKDLVGVFESLNNKSIPIFIRNIKIEDTSTELNYIDTLTVELEDANRQRSTIKVDIPKFIDGKFMWLGGNNKIITNQNFLHPVVKTGPDTVQVVTNYNKMFITRDDTKSLGVVEKLYKILGTETNFQNSFKLGNTFGANHDKITTIEFDELSKVINEFSLNGTMIYFDLSKVDAMVQSNNIKVPNNNICIGKTKDGPIFINTETQMTKDGKTILELILDAAPESIRSKYGSLRTPKRNMYAKVKTMEKNIPVIILLSFWEGLSQVMDKMSLSYRLTSTYPKDIQLTEDVIRFKDCYLVYRADAGSALLMSGLKYMSTESYDLAMMDTPDPYLDVFKKIYGKVSIANALDNTYEFTIDHITKETLIDLNLPTDIVNLMIYAVKLLSDNQYKSELYEGTKRIRQAEIIPAILYDTIAKNYITYKNSTGRKKLSIPRDSVIKKLLELKTVEDYSTLNPILEMERTHAISNKGWRGVNLDYSYTVEKRGYDDSMVGIIGLVTSPDGSVGVARTLTLEPKIESVRGYVDVVPTDQQTKVMKDVNLFSPGELSIPMGPVHDDPTRMGHALKQAKHVIPVKNSSPVLISNGLEEIARFNLSSSFVVNAKMNGKVVEFDEKNKIMVVLYSNGEHQAINLAPVVVKNGGGGFYVANQLITNLKLGDKFTANAALAWNKDFFTNNMNGCRLNIGTLVKVALTSTYNTHQDATYVTELLSDKASTDMVFQRSVDIGMNANVSHIVKIGDHVEIGDSLVKFDTSFEDNTLNEFLAALSKDPRLESEIMESSINDIKTDTAGIIEDIKIFSAVDVDDLSPTLKTIVKGYYKSINSRKNLLKKYDDSDSIVRCGMMITEPTRRVEPNKFGVIRGKKAEDSVIIEFYIKHTELLETGSKIANYTGLKNTICERIPKGYEPFSEFRPNEEISSIIASNSILKRMTNSIVLIAFGNKLIIELKRAVIDLYDKNKTTPPLVKASATKLIYGFFDIMDKSGINTKKYKAMLEPMSDRQFIGLIESMKADDNAYFILDIVDYERTIRMEDLEKGASYLKIPLFETVSQPHLTMDKDMVIQTPEPVPVGYIHIKRTQQTVMKKNGISTSIDQRSSNTGQVTGGDKNGRETDLENSMLISIGLEKTLQELNGPRADDMVMKNEMLQQIATKGYVELDTLTNDVKNKTTLNTIDVFMIGMGLKSDLVTKGMMLRQTLEKDLR